VTYLARLPKLAIIAIAAMLLLALFVVFRPQGDTKTVTAYFSRAVQVYKDTQLRILGVPVGKVTAVVPEGNSVRVDMEYDSQYSVPADAQAVIVTPTLTADRFIQLSPAYTSGPKLADGAHIDLQNTGTPIELDRIYRSLADLTKALGPNGVNKDGTLNHLLGSGSKFLKGKGAKANATIVNLSRMMKTFGDGSSELFGTVSALEQFSGTLAANNTTVSNFMANLGQVSQQLAGEKGALRAALHALAQVLGKVENFVRGNRRNIVANFDNLMHVLRDFGNEKKTLETILNIAPSAMNNLAIAFDPKSGTIGSRINAQGDVATMHQLMCALVKDAHLPTQAEACALFKQLLAPFEGPAYQNMSGQSGEPRSSGVKQVRYGSAPSARNLGELLGGGT
jgi:phospholipid/cholesterol/gamma-HCH transport system substrate-binding protein